MRGTKWVLASVLLACVAVAAWAASARIQGTLPDGTGITQVWATEQGISIYGQGSGAIRAYGQVMPGGVVRADGGMQITARANMAGPVASMQVSADANQTVTVTERDKSGNVLYRVSGLLRQPGGVITY